MERKKKKIILAIAGEIASGKNEMANYVAKKYRGASYRLSEVLRDILQRLNLPESRENMQNVSTMLREYFGTDILSKVAVSDLSKTKNRIIAINGVRRLSDIVALKKHFRVKLIYIKSDMEKRYNRIVKRSENPDDKKKTFTQFKRDHTKEAEVQICGLEKKADAVIENNGTRRDFHRKIDEVVKKFNR